MNNKKYPISIFTTIWGHRSMAVAVKNDLGNKYNTYLNVIIPTPLSSVFVNVIYTLCPSFNKIPYKIVQNPYINALLDKYNSRSYKKIIEQFIKKQKPEIVISTYFPFNKTFIELSKKYKFNIISVLANPKIFFPSEVIPNALNLVFDSDAEKECLKLGIHKINLVKSGWFVRNIFQKPYNKIEVRKSISLEPNTLTITIVGGSQGMINILKILPIFMNINKKFQVIFICGKNKKLFKLLSFIKKTSNLINDKSLNFEIIGHIENVHEYLKAADVVIGKAGPNLLFETVATYTPFFAISHISGQEDGNLDIIRKYKVGFVEENPLKAIKLTRKIINKPNILKDFQMPLEKLANYNHSSHPILLGANNKIILQRKNYLKKHDPTSKKYQANIINH